MDFFQLVPFTLTYVLNFVELIFDDLVIAYFYNYIGELFIMSVAITFLFIGIKTVRKFIF